VDPPRRTTGDVVATLALLLHVGLALLFLVLSFGIAMSTDNCAYVECGDEKWIGGICHPAINHCHRKSIL
jgi:hypothetical protein